MSDLKKIQESFKEAEKGLCLGRYTTGIGFNSDETLSEIHPITRDTIRTILMELKLAEIELKSIPGESVFLLEPIQTRIENIIKQLTEVLT